MNKLIIAIGGLFGVYCGTLLYVITHTFVNSFGEDFRTAIHNVNDMFTRFDDTKINLILKSIPALPPQFEYNGI